MLINCDFEMEQAKMETTFNWNSEAYAAANSIQASVGERLIESIPFMPDMAVLDAGCGSGNLTVLLAQKVPDGQVLAIDSSASMIQKAEEFTTARNTQNVIFQVCGINEFDLSEQFDIIFTNSVLHWVIEIEEGLKRMFAALKSGGLFAAQFPMLNAEHPLIKYASRSIKALGLKKRYEKWHFPWFVPNSREQFIGMLKEAGFDEPEVSMESNMFAFPSAEAVYQHFNSVGLDLLAAPLCEEEKELFLNRIMSDLKEDFPDEAFLRYERIFTKARKA